MMGKLEDLRRKLKKGHTASELVADGYPKSSVYLALRQIKRKPVTSLPVRRKPDREFDRFPGKLTWHIEEELTSFDLEDMEPKEILQRVKPLDIVEREILKGLRFSLFMGHKENAEGWKSDLCKHRAYKELMRELKRR